MRPRKIVRTTLGDLVIALTDQVAPFMRDPSDAYRIVSCMLSGLLAQNGVRAEEAKRRRTSVLTQELLGGNGL
jgi:hypothetical protein